MSAQASQTTQTRQQLRSSSPDRAPLRALALGLAALLSLSLLGPAPIVSAADSTGSDSSSSSTDPGTGEGAAFVDMASGDKGWRVRILQSRLHQLGLHGEVLTGRFDRATVDGVRTFQKRRAALRQDGVVDEATWAALVARTATPTNDALKNVFVPGPTLAGPGSSGPRVRAVQARLKQLGLYKGEVTKGWTPRAGRATRAFQAKQRIPVTGEVDARTLDRLLAATRTPTRAELFNIVPKGPALDPRCLTGRVMCIDKTSRTLRWVVDGVVRRDVEVRFGSAELPTREGQFSVFAKSRDHVSSIYHTPMPFAMFFSGGQAVHYSPDFAANGYAGASHGCVNVRDRGAITALFDEVALGDTVIVYWSARR